MIEVYFRYPLIMKMEMTSRLQIDETLTIDKVKEKVFNDFWKHFASMEKHGSFHNVEIFHDNKKIETQEEWQECLIARSIFNVIFQKTPHGE